MIVWLLLFHFHWAQAQSVPVPAGTFLSLFADKGELETKIGPLLVDKTPVTNASYLKFLKNSPSWRKSRVAALFADSSYLKSWPGDLKFPLKEGEHPVVQVSWFAARAYCESKGGRLPTTAEWEYFSDSQNPEHQAETLKWYSKAQEKSKPVGQGKPNKFGLLDTRGSVWEWVEDFSSAIMPGDSREGPMKDLFCGGSSLKAKDPQQYASFLRYAFRSSLKANYTASALGFRCVKDPPVGVQK